MQEKEKLKSFEPGALTKLIAERANNQEGLNMSGVNQVHLSGRVVEVNIIPLRDNKELTKVKVKNIFQREYNGKITGNPKEGVFEVTVWRDKQKLKVGDEIVVLGRLEAREYKSKTTGKPMTFYDVVAETVHVEAFVPKPDNDFYEKDIPLHTDENYTGAF